MSDDWVSQLEFNDESVSLIVRRLALECHEFAVARDISGSSVEDHLSLVLDVLDGNLGGIMRFEDIPATGAGDICGLAIRFSSEGYRRLADAAKDRMAGAVDID